MLLLAVYVCPPLPSSCTERWWWPWSSTRASAGVSMGHVHMLIRSACQPKLHDRRGLHRGWHSSGANAKAASGRRNL